MMYISIKTTKKYNNSIDQKHKIFNLYICIYIYIYGVLPSIGQKYVKMDISFLQHVNHS